MCILRQENNLNPEEHTPDGRILGNWIGQLVGKGEIWEGDSSWYLPSGTIYVGPLSYKVDGPVSVGPDPDPQNTCGCIHFFTRYAHKRHSQEHH